MSRRAAFLLSAALAIAVYTNSIPNDFAYDDGAIVVKNERVHGLGRWRELWSEPYWLGGTGEGAGLYRPITSLTFAVDWAVWNAAPEGFHLFNVLAHAAVTVLLLAWLLRFFRPGAAFVGAALFALHPVHTEAVANVVGRAEILAAGFVLASLLVLGDPARTRRPARNEEESAAPGWTRWVCLLGAASLYGLGVLSKEGAIVLPGLLFAADAARGGLAHGMRAYLRGRGAAYAALLFVALVVIAARFAVLGSVVNAEPADAFVPDASFATRFFTMIRVWPHYARLLLAPFDLSADYSPAVILPVGEITAQGLFGLGLAAAAIAIGWHAWRRDPRVTAGLAWIALAILPVSNLFFVAGVVLAERTLYLPSAGLSLLAASVAERFALVPRARWAAVAYGGWLALFAAVVVKRSPDWKDSAALFNSIRRSHPESYVAHWVLASDLVRRGQWADATRRYESAYRIWPHEYTLSVDMAGHLLRTGDPERAAAVAADATDLKPDRPAAWQLTAVALYRQGRFAQAAELGGLAPHEVRRSLWFAYMMGAAHEALGAPGRAEEWWARVRAPGPSLESWVPLYEVARLQLDRGDTALAKQTIFQGLRAAAGDSTGLGFLTALGREVNGDR